MSAYPICGHSACRQNFIDTGSTGCVRVNAVDPAPLDLRAVMDRYGFTCGDPDSDCSRARAAVAEWERVLRRLVAWNNNVNGDGRELGEICREAEAAIALATGGAR